jgi:alpha-tubulin suppressor-like RCC1 family protein
MNLSAGFSTLASHIHFIGEDDALYGGWSDNDIVLGIKGEWDTHAVVVLPEEYTDKKLDIISYAAGSEHSLFITREGRLYVWGTNGGQLGGKGSADIHAPQELTLPTTEKPRKVYCGDHFSLVLTQKGSVYGFGKSADGQLMVRHTVDEPMRLSLPPIHDMVLGWCHVLASGVDGKWYGWGFNNDGQLGVAGQWIEEPALCPFTFRRIWVGSFHCLGETEEGDYFSWGWNAGGQLGLGHMNPIKKPERINLKGVVDVAAEAPSWCL